MSDTAINPARQALTEWVTANVPEDQRREVSKLVAAYVAECVRDDRRKLTAAAKAAEAFRKSVRDAMAKVDALHGKPAFDVDSLFRQAYGR